MLKKRNKLLPLFGVIALVLAFFASAKASYATNLYRTDSISASLVTAWYHKITPESVSGGDFLWGRDVDYYVRVTFNIADFDLNRYYQGYCTVSDSFTYTFTQTDPNNNAQLVGYEILDVDNPENTQVVYNYPGSITNNSLTIGVNFIQYVNGDWPVGYPSYTYHFKVRFYINCSSPFRYWSDSVSHGTFSYGGRMYSWNKSEVMEGYILDALNAGNTSILDTLQNDSSGASTALNTNIGLYDTAESQASSAMAGALPNADTELGSITAYDYGSIYTDNVSSFSFWKSIGDFILSNSNLVGIGALLILCMFLGLVVYLLRL